MVSHPFKLSTVSITNLGAKNAKPPILNELFGQSAMFCKMVGAALGLKLCCGKLSGSGAVFNTAPCFQVETLVSNKKFPAVKVAD